LARDSKAGNLGRQKLNLYSPPTATSFINEFSNQRLENLGAKKSEKKLSIPDSSITPNPQKNFAFKTEPNPFFCIAATLNWL